MEITPKNGHECTATVLREFNKAMWKLLVNIVRYRKGRDWRRLKRIRHKYRHIVSNGYKFEL